jgi:predicted  nucleic acid-binding Zn-ribbon protein
MDSIQIIQALNELQTIARTAKPVARSAATAPLTSRQVALRAQIPTSILGHFDRMLAQRKPGIAAVRNGVCGACHLRIPRAHVAGIKGSHELDVCDQCGTFIYSEEMLEAAHEGKLVTAAS